ncbi:phosphatidate cytidylyltransferase [Rhizobium sp. BK251]|uniref:phosphatidate cytidylyltransferase n=1 Tax=Rhizobium sp. BK251 TaxID=2512125 RepID=UPI00104DFDBA|nr:phosphatidate cytidylyltransferase [Rhizobium sp. BK251]TCL74019.1 phosphatidate cytidylyltransferase [Rhizobium sp. BK251]
MQRELQLRIVSGVILAAVVLAATWYGGFVFRLVASLIALLVYYEWTSIIRLHERDIQANAIGWLGQVAVAAATLAGETGYAVGLLALFTVVTVARSLFRAGTWWSPVGVVYAGMTGIALAEIRGDDAVGFVAMLFIFAVVWATDILAYFVGRSIGGPKLAPAISPGKTWSGAIGGAVSAVIAGTAVAYAFFPSVGWGIALVALLLSVCSQAGDLFESFIKRRFGVKDSSHLIPGHGGVMDRVDGLIFACFAAFLLAIVLALAKNGDAASLSSLLLDV